MFEKLKRKPTTTIVQVVKEEPKYIVPEERAEKWKRMKYEAKDEIVTFLNTLDRVDLMHFQDSKQFDGTPCEDAVWEAANDSEWSRDYPMGEHEYQSRIPDIVRENIPIKYQDPTGKKNILDLNNLVQKIDGIQKKLDKIETLISNAEFKLCGKDALKL